MIKCPRAVLSTSRKLSVPYTLGPLLLVTVTLCCAATQLSWCPQPPLYIGVVNIGGSRTFAVWFTAQGPFFLQAALCGHRQRVTLLIISKSTSVAHLR